MPNLYSKLTNYVIAGYAYKDRRRTSQQIVDSIKQEWPTQNAPETIPSVIAKDPSITTSETTFTSTLGRKWQTFTLRPIQDESDKVMVFYHGGGWIMGASSYEWKTPREALAAGCHVVNPVWTLAPLDNAIDFAHTSVDFILSVAEDPQWRNKEIVLSGCSAGGWCALRTLLALCETACASDANSNKQSRARAALGRIRDLILIVPASSLELTEELREAEKSDVLLSYSLLSVVYPLWAFGATEYPEIFATLPNDAQDRAKAIRERTANMRLSDPLFSPVNGLASLKRYIEEDQEHLPFRVTTFHGTADILYSQSVQLHTRLRALGKAVATEELNTAEGMSHAYVISPFATVESRAAVSRIRELLH